MDSFVITIVKDFLFIAGTITIGVGLASWITALFTKKDWKVVHIKLETEKEKYEKKYDEEFDELNVHELNEDENADFKESICVDDCPRGKVIMRYNLDEETFEYFTNSRNIPHSYLDVVAKKFIIENDCKIIYKLEVKVGETDETDGDDGTDGTDGGDEKEVETQKEETSDNDKEEETSVFATFKKAEKTKQTPLIVKIINKYKSVGTIEDYDNLTSQNQTNTREAKVIKLTFKDYKSMVEKSEK